jgi:hypothetical protein|nr:MAG TPA: hypothetical protein [Caudoviricetes sp.]
MEEILEMLDKTSKKTNSKIDVEVIGKNTEVKIFGDTIGVLAGISEIIKLTKVRMKEDGTDEKEINGVLESVFKEGMEA